MYLTHEGTQFRIVGKPVFLDGCLWVWLCDQYHNLTCPTPAASLPYLPLLSTRPHVSPPSPPSSHRPCPHHCSLSMPSSSDPRKHGCRVGSLLVLWHQVVYTVQNNAWPLAAHTAVHMGLHHCSFMACRMAHQHVLCVGRAEQERLKHSAIPFWEI